MQRLIKSILRRMSWLASSMRGLNLWEVRWLHLNCLSEDVWRFESPQILIFIVKLIKPQQTIIELGMSLAGLPRSLRFWVKFFMFETRLLMTWACRDSWESKLSWGNPSRGRRSWRLHRKSTPPQHTSSTPPFHHFHRPHNSSEFP